MNRYGTRMTQIEERGPRLERQFVGWPGNPWTPEQMAKAIRQHPQQRVFLRSLLETEVRGQRAEGGGQTEAEKRPWINPAPRRDGSAAANCRQAEKPAMRGNAEDTEDGGGHSGRPLYRSRWPKRKRQQNH